MNDDPHQEPGAPAHATPQPDAQRTPEMEAPGDAAGWNEAKTLSRLRRIAKLDPIADTPTAPLGGATLPAAATPAMDHASHATTNPKPHTPTPYTPPTAMVATPSASPASAIPATPAHAPAPPHSLVASNAADVDDVDDVDDALPDDLAPTEAALPTPGEALRVPPWRRGPVERPGGRQAPSYSYGSLGLRKGGPTRLERASAHAETQNQRVWRPRMIFVAFGALGVVGVVVAIVLAVVVTSMAGNLFAPGVASPGTNTLIIPTTPPSQRTPGAKGSVAPGSGFLTGSLADAPHAANLTNLTSSANSDWAHWGLTTASDYNHKATGAGQIGNYSVIGGAAPQQITNAAVAYSWSDGQPTASVTGSTTGVLVAGAGAGLTFSVPASTSARTLTVYVSSYHAEGVFNARLTDNSAAPYTDTTISGVNGALTGVYTITFQAGSGGHHLVISFTDQTDYQPDGYVSLQAATLN